MNSPLPPKIAGRYRTIRVIGKGGMGVVYEVEHELTSERLALKLLASRSHANHDTVARFKREAQASARIKSEHVVHVTDAGVAPELEDAPFLVMELLEGTDLEHATGTEPQSERDTVCWLRQVARALDKAHLLGIVHRDLKPENLFLTHREDGSPLVKILDFGIVKMLTEQGSTTQDGQLLGTPMYMAPEQINRQGAITGATDRYALGLIAHKLLSGCHYRQGESLIQVVADVMQSRVRAPSTRGSAAGRAFDRWFQRACHPDPEQRFPSSGEQIEELAACLGLPKQPLELSSTGVESELDAPTVEIEGQFNTVSRRGPRQVWWVGTLLGTVVLVAFASALMAGWSHREAEVGVVSEPATMAGSIGNAIAPSVTPASASVSASRAVLFAGQAPAASKSSVIERRTVPTPTRAKGKQPALPAPLKGASAFGSNPLAEQK